MVVGQRLVKEKEWLESFKDFGIEKEDGKKIIHRLGHTLLNEHEKLLAATGGTHSGPPVACCSCWGKAYRSVPPSLPREVKSWGVI